MKKADTLSRQPNHTRGVENDNSNITLLKPEYFQICTMHQRHLLTDGSEKETLSKIRKCDNLDKEVIKVLKEMKGEKKKSIRGDEWVEEQGLILLRGKVYVPRNEELRKEITCLHHYTFILGHLGHWKMLELVMGNYWWPGISKHVLSYVDGCDVCQRGENISRDGCREIQHCGWIFLWILLWDYLKHKGTMQYLLFVTDSQNKSILFLL